MGWLRQIKRPKVLLPVLIVVVIIAVAVLAVRTFNSPAQGTVTTQVSDTTAGQPIKQPAYKTYSDQIVSFSYPSRYAAEAGPKNSGYLDVIDLVKTQQRTEFASIGVYPGSLANESGISFRRSHPELYKPVPAGDVSVVYAKTDSKEYTGFLQRGSDVVTISFTSVGPYDFSADYQTVAGSLQLKR